MYRVTVFNTKDSNSFTMDVLSTCEIDTIVKYSIEDSTAFQMLTKYFLEDNLLEVRETVKNIVLL